MSCFGRPTAAKSNPDFYFNRKQEGSARGRVKYHWTSGDYYSTNVWPFVYQNCRKGYWEATIFLYYINCLHHRLSTPSTQKTPTAMGPLSLAMWLSLFGLAMSKPAHPHKPNSYIVTLRREVGDDDKFSFENVGQKMKNKAGKAKLKKNFGIGRFKAILVEDEDDDDIRQVNYCPNLV